MWALSTGNLVSLSEQQFVECDITDSGCNGGWMNNAFSFVKTSSVCADGSYLHTATGSTCSLSGCQVDLNDCVNDVQVNSLQYCSGHDGINDTVSKSFIRVDVPLVRSSCSSVGEMTCTSSGDTPSAIPYCCHRVLAKALQALRLLVRSTPLKTVLLALPAVSPTESARVTAGRVKATPGLHRLRY